MGKGRLEAFSDGVLAIIITIMVLELKAPHEADLEALEKLAPTFFAYVLSFVYVGIYWNNHHHLVHTLKRVTAGVMWANLHLLFWLSLLPFATAWAGEHPHDSLPSSVYGVPLLMSALAYGILQRTMEGAGSTQINDARVVRKSWISRALYAAGIGLAFVRPWISQLCYAAVAVMWMIPDRRVEMDHAGST
jgi:uncharacterized membrane protein